MINYYMFYGGSNFGYSAASTVTQSYDYNAPLREWGGKGERYDAVQAIGQMLQEYGQKLIDSDSVELTMEGDHPGVSIYLRRSKDGSRFYFVRNSQEHESRLGVVKVRQRDGPEQKLKYSLGNFGAKVLYVPPGAHDLADGEWLPKPIEPGQFRSLRLKRCQCALCRSPQKSPETAANVSTGEHLEFADIFDQRYVYYRVNFELTTDDLSAPLGPSYSLMEAENRS